MDEPLSNLDAKLRLEMRQEIRRIHQALGSTTIYVTHDQEEAMSLADRIVVLRDGAIRQVGTPDELYNAPAHLDVADFMGFRNRIPGTITTTQDGHVALDVGHGAMLTGVAQGSLTGGAALAVIRPDDLYPTTEGGIPATVVALEYRGREFHGVARTASDVEVHFATHTPVAPGDAIRLGAEPQRVLVFADTAP